jgi:hypothetical protein
MLVPILLLEDMDMGQVSTFLRRFSVLANPWTSRRAEKSRLLSSIGQLIESAKAELGTGLRRFRRKLRPLKAASKTLASSR